MCILSADFQDTKISGDRSRAVYCSVRPEQTQTIKGEFGKAITAPLYKSPTVGTSEEIEFAVHQGRFYDF
jgi:hypothetical protein